MQNIGAILYKDQINRAIKETDIFIKLIEKGLDPGVSFQEEYDNALNSLNFMFCKTTQLYCAMTRQINESNINQEDKDVLFGSLEKLYQRGQQLALMMQRHHYDQDKMMLAFAENFYLGGSQLSMHDLTMQVQDCYKSASSYLDYAKDDLSKTIITANQNLEDVSRQVQLAAMSKALVQYCLYPASKIGFGDSFITTGGLQLYIDKFEKKHRITTDLTQQGCSCTVKYGYDTERNLNYAFKSHSQIDMLTQRGEMKWSQMSGKAFETAFNIYKRKHGAWHQFGIKPSIGFVGTVQIPMGDSSRTEKIASVLAGIVKSAAKTISPFESVLSQEELGKKAFEALKEIGCTLTFSKSDKFGKISFEEDLSKFLIGDAKDKSKALVQAAIKSFDIDVDHTGANISEEMKQKQIKGTIEALETSFSAVQNIATGNVLGFMSSVVGVLEPYKDGDFLSPSQQNERMLHYTEKLVEIADLQENQEIQTIEELSEHLKRITDELDPREYNAFNRGVDCIDTAQFIRTPHTHEHDSGIDRLER